MCIWLRNMGTPVALSIVILTDRHAYPVWYSFHLKTAHTRLNITLSLSLSHTHTHMYISYMSQNIQRKFSNLNLTTSAQKPLKIILLCQQREYRNEMIHRIEFIIKLRQKSITEKRTFIFPLLMIPYYLFFK